MKKFSFFTSILILSSLIFSACSMEEDEKEEENKRTSIPSSAYTDVTTPVVQTTANTVANPTSITTRQPTQTVQRKHNTKTKAS
ncbi:MAG: hypothetical protein PHQ95_01615 [Candidatus Gracilibacteria bacterium]|nr:hypothetical protein [Candidatus Gracilibacteria bacterium]